MICARRSRKGSVAIQASLPAPFWEIANGINPSPHSAAIPTPS
jgi:hypothetical protein